MLFSEIDSIGNDSEEPMGERAQLYLKAASAGDAEAQFQIASCYLLGKGAPFNVALATKWYLKASEQGHGEACIQLFRLNAPFVTMKRASVPEPALRSSERARPFTHIEDKMQHLVGMDRIKQQLSSYLGIYALNKLRAQHGFSNKAPHAHMVFTGNPGTGKTTTARMLGDIFKEAGILPQGHVVEMTPNDVFDESTCGKEIQNMKRKINQAKGGILFIDEAHNFPEHAGKGTEFWRNSITTLLQAMTAKPSPEFFVIMAGYEDGIKRLFMLEPGLKSRFQSFIHFDNYSTKELVAIFERYAHDSQYSLTQECRDLLIKVLDEMPQRLAKSFGNARAVQNVFDETLRCAASRILRLSAPTKEDVSTITAFDINTAWDKIQKSVI